MARYQEEDARRRRLIEFDWRTSARRDRGLIKGNPIRASETLQVTLSQDRVARLSNLYQYATYAGALAGIPFDPELSILTAVEFAEKLHPDHSRPPVILEPVFETGAISRQLKTQRVKWDGSCCRQCARSQNSIPIARSNRKMMGRALS